MITEKQTTLEQYLERLYEQDDNSFDNSLDNISDSITDFIDKKLKDCSYSCLECDKIIKIIYLSKKKIKYTCCCEKPAEIKLLKDLEYHKLEETEYFESEILEDNNQKIEEKIKKLNVEIKERFQKNENYINYIVSKKEDTIKIDSSLNDFKNALESLAEKENIEAKFLIFCYIIINNFKNYPSYIENLNKIYEFFFSLKIEYKFSPGYNKLFGDKFYKRNQKKFIIYVEGNEVNKNDYTCEKEQMLEGILIIKEGEKLDNLSYMFHQVSSLLSIQDIQFMNDSNVEDLNNMDYIFYNCSSFKSLSKWNFTKYKNNMFFNCSLLKIDSDNENFSSSKNSEQSLSSDNDKLNENNKNEKKNYFKILSYLKNIFKIFILILNFILFIIKFNDNIDNSVVLKKEVWEDYETKVGAYYIAFTPLRNDYSKITGDIKLPISLNTNNGKRIAYISLGVLGFNGRINIGIINSNFGWTPFYYDTKYKKMEGFTDYICPEETEIIKFKLELLNLSKILFSLNYFDSNSIFIDSFKIEIDISHILVIQNNKVKFRFYRYIQLRPVENDNQNDGTYMENGELRELYIVKKNRSKPWGIMGKNVDAAWKVSSKHIKLHFKRNKEIFSIIHN